MSVLVEGRVVPAVSFVVTAEGIIVLVDHLAVFVIGFESTGVVCDASTEDSDDPTDEYIELDEGVVFRGKVVDVMAEGIDVPSDHLDVPVNGSVVLDEDFSNGKRVTGSFVRMDCLILRVVGGAVVLVVRVLLDSFFDVDCGFGSVARLVDFVEDIVGVSTVFRYGLQTEKQLQLLWCIICNKVNVYECNFNHVIDSKKCHSKFLCFFFFFFF